ncbi:SDR family oxidoreductase [Thalassobius sp. Cn5-15]|uniref:SDR family oxidoreductase n=1 Tax=Thalassobius sp. Cn5-15 TaxID=2917763 RepID=UPI001EF19E32|nr:SDR family oxidoreductase [Thalassobius sp. Cn5-15]MCG7494494.1 SDR family oxidoreductase [Thalassobius sp. Cn5-15]
MAVALVTGAGKRLGRAMALYLAGRGYDLAVHYASSAPEAAEVVAEARSMGRKAEAFQADLLIEEEAAGLFPRVAAAFDTPITCLVNNASVFEYDRLETVSRDSWDRHLNSNLRAPFLLIQGMAAQVPEATRDENGELLAQGLVVNMVDQRVRKLTPEFMTYTLSKMGLWTLTQTAALSLAPHVRVNAIGPGSTLIGARQAQDHFDAQRSNSILQRGPNVSDIVAALGFFLDSPAITGQLLCSDGGQHLAWQTPDIINKRG